MSTYYALRGHEPVRVDDVLEWARFFENSEGRRVAWTELPGGVQVSTVFLGLDHNYLGGPPLLFESMIFGGPHAGEMDRYSTWDEAVRGHEAMLRLAGGVH